MNPVLILTRNNLELTKKCVESVRGQDIPTRIYIWDNGSTDGTREWLQDQYSDDKAIIPLWLNGGNEGVSKGWNEGLEFIFIPDRRNHVLVLNNDAIIPPWFYRRLINYNQPFITGVAVDVMPTEQVPHCPLTPNPDFSAFLIRRDAWDRIGKFDEGMKIYSSDQDYHIRGWMAGVPMLKANVPYYHVNSQTLKRATPEDRAAIEQQANLDREELRKKWGVSAGGADYQALFIEENFGSQRGPSYDTNDIAT